VLHTRRFTIIYGLSLDRRSSRSLDVESPYAYPTS